MQFPAARAGASFFERKTSGQFHGMMAAPTPYGCLSETFMKPGVLSDDVPTGYAASLKYRKCVIA